MSNTCKFRSKSLHKSRNQNATLSRAEPPTVDHCAAPGSFFTGSSDDGVLADWDCSFNCLNCCESNESLASVEMGEKLAADALPLCGDFQGTGDACSGVVLPKPVTGDRGLPGLLVSAGVCGLLMSAKSKGTFCIRLSELLRFQAAVLAL